jgi:hypothetical protein
LDINCPVLKLPSVSPSLKISMDICHKPRSD